MSRKAENTGFTCLHCGKQVMPLDNGSYRNHCPHCLYSLHVDIRPGDRLHGCRGLMQPVNIIHHSKKGLQVVHQCTRCGELRVNRIAVATVMPDCFERILQLIAQTQS